MGGDPTTAQGPGQGEYDDHDVEDLPRRPAGQQAANAVAARAVAPVIAPEAVMWQHIEVVTDRWGRPGMRLSSRVAQAIDDSLGAGACDPGRWAVSLTHEGDWAAAIVLCLGPGPGERAGGRG